MTVPIVMRGNCCSTDKISSLLSRYDFWELFKNPVLNRYRPGIVTPEQIDHHLITHPVLRRLRAIRSISFASQTAVTTRDWIFASTPLTVLSVPVRLSQNVNRTLSSPAQGELVPRNLFDHTSSTRLCSYGPVFPGNSHVFSTKCVSDTVVWVIRFSVRL